MLLLWSIASAPTLSAAETNLVDRLRGALQPRALAWGEVRVGRHSGIEPDPRAAAAGEKLRDALAQSRPKGAAAVAQAKAADAQQNAIRLLRQQAGQDIEVHLRPGNQTVIQIRGGVLQAPARVAKANETDPAEATARAFLRAQRALLGLLDPDRELKLEAQQREANGERHLKFSQQFQGLPVWPAGLSVHLDAQGNVTLVDGAYVPTPDRVALEPALNAAEAVEGAKKSLTDGASATATDPELIIYAPLEAEPRLAWKMDVSMGLLRAWRMVVDAQDGRVLSRVNQVCNAGATGSGKDMGGIARNLSVWSDGGKFYLIDSTKQMFVAGSDPMKDPKGVISIYDARQVENKDLKTVYLVESATTGDWLPDAVSAAYNFSETYDYFLERFNRNSLDGKGGTIKAAVRVGKMDNAYWNGNLKFMFFGDVQPYPEALDVVGHELTHGLTQHSADLVYEQQPGALNESFSDIFGEMVEGRTAGKPDWKIGTRLNEVFRDMRDPGSIQIGGLGRPYPSKMSEFLDLPNDDNNDHGGVHLNSSIFNHCFYLLAEGLTGAIGLADAEKIFFRALTQHLQKQSQFIDARLACVAAAEALFGPGSTQAQKTAEAFDAVEIFAKPPTPEPSPIPAVTGEDSTLLVSIDPFTDEIALGRREAALNDPPDGMALAEPVKAARPAVSGDGSLAVYVNGFADICAVPTDNPLGVECLGLEGMIHAVTISPDGKYAAFVLLDPSTGEPDNRIQVYDFTTEQFRTYELLAPVLDGSPVDQVLYADEMIFTSDSSRLIYDAVSQIHFGGGDPVQAWSIFSINLATDSTVVLVPPLESADFGNPSIGRAGNRYLTFDAIDYSLDKNLILNLDLFTGELAQVGEPGDGFGYPCFNGDETAVIYAAEDPNALFTGFSLVKQNLTPDRLGTVGQPTLWLPDAAIGVIYRRGTFVGANQPPTVALTAPADNATFNPPAQVELAATASDPDGAVAKVEFFDGANKLGETAAAPYTFTWKNVPSGSYRLIARAYDNLGAANDSAAIRITVGQGGGGGGQIKLTGARSATGIRLTIQASAGPCQLQRSSDLRTWTDAQTLTMDASGTLSVEEPSAGNARLFYRVLRR